MKDIVFHPAADPVMVHRWSGSTQLCFAWSSGCKCGWWTRIPEYLAKHLLAFRGHCSIRWYRISCCHLQLV